MKILLTAFTLVALPFAAAAECSGGHQQALTCMEGTELNPETGICETVVTG